MEPNPFWLFSLRIYAEPVVAELCLRLQDEFGVNVNLLLFCCWLDVNGIDKGEHFLHSVEAAVKQWQTEVVQPLRRVRRWVDAGDFYQRLKAVELEAERLEQDMLYNAFCQATSKSGKGGDYLTQYLSQYQGVTEEILTPLVEVLQDSGFGNVFVRYPG